MLQELKDFKEEEFFGLISGATSRILMTDYDGTLSPFKINRNEAFPYEGVREVLDTIMDTGHTRLVIITGRAIQDLLPLLQLKTQPEIWGSHGWEHSLNKDHYELKAFPKSARKKLDEAETILASLVAPEAIERKPVSVAVHWRGRSPTEVADIKSQVVKRWEKLTLNAPLNVHPFDGGLELRLVGRNKGYPVRQILDGIDNYVATYLGDDLTDEDAYEVLGNKGLKVLVREEPRPTKATLWLRPPNELLAFLNKWHRAINNNQA